MTTKWYQDPALREDLSSSAFWILGIVIGVNAYWTNRQVELFIESEKASKAADKASNDGDSSSPPDESRATPAHDPKPLWLQPHITSRPRKLLAIALCSLVLPMQFVEGYWVLRTAWRLSVAMLKAAYPQEKLRILGALLYLFTALITLAAWAGVLAMGVFLVSMQMLYVLQLRELNPGAPVGAGSGEEKKEKRKGDGEWDELEDVESVEGGVGNEGEEHEKLLGTAKS
ncbi:hypothetical protein F4779DRAFT_575336 [Xylariaceae sp. FL0662B]|nr:hypothetical protein F4779DRAFT_575336 [Xylariaceae sp. FL0662B]